MTEENRKPLIIPENCPPKDYVIHGFTKSDAAWIAAASLLGALLGIWIYTVNGNSIIAVVIFFLSAAISINIFRRDAAAENLLDKIKIIHAYKKASKVYEFEYINIWEMKRNDKGRI